ncbi:bifunctional phosphopantothenoylcysteine decarboxylase/phosphopantothenate--cysteine ligase CoaBC [Cytophagaceae bacterium AH-315-L13]|nr:bifunctional phosphopantothenoylcysteine decarboxylase/phosphopantothenate--cysteine ligase CoaBC [Cytophagaceae bacterium AH-315-L13]
MARSKNSLKDRKILIGITGGIAAYKITFLIRDLVKSGAEVQTIMTPDSKEFVTPVTISTLSKNPVLSEFNDDDTGEWYNHVELGSWADLFLIAPLTANTLAKIANGFCDNLLCATYLSAKCPVVVAPAMDEGMYLHPTTNTNLQKIKEHGVKIIDPEHGELASGLIGEGRMAEPERIFKELSDLLTFSSSKTHSTSLSKKKALVTAGPTFEAIDPVRFIGNHSSGKMGVAIANELADQGVEVDLILGPSDIEISNSKINCIRVTSADEMYKNSTKSFANADIAVLAAAVADYTPQNVSDVKIKKDNGSMTLKLAKTKDILKELGKVKSKDQLLIGFAVETDNELENAAKKLKEKNLNFIVLNSLNDDGAGFKMDTNKVTILDDDNNVQEFELKSKDDVAKDIVRKIASYYK